MTVRTASSAIVKAAAILAGTIPLMAWRRRRDADETGRGSECHVGVETTLALAGDGRSTPISPNVHQGRRGCARGIPRAKLRSRSRRGTLTGWQMLVKGDDDEKTDLVSRDRHDADLLERFVDGAAPRLVVLALERRRGRALQVLDQLVHRVLEAGCAA